MNKTEATTWIRAHARVRLIDIAKAYNMGVPNVWMHLCHVREVVPSPVKLALAPFVASVVSRHDTTCTLIEAEAIMARLDQPKANHSVS